MVMAGVGGKLRLCRYRSGSGNLNVGNSLRKGDGFASKSPPAQTPFQYNEGTVCTHPCPLWMPHPQVTNRAGLSGCPPPDFTPPFAGMRTSIWSQCHQSSGTTSIILYERNTYTYNIIWINMYAPYILCSIARNPISRGVGGWGLEAAPDPFATLPRPPSRVGGWTRVGPSNPS